ncbi:hypothetical protein B9Z19DRAFT_1166361 [Tuber borchii]|uniref:DUF7881 domain-containing protein n=1 Tax=Tuber borchii TaxID=42251 RepID=A0A2T6ZBH2_TUBBO|nr:hypothetical protein B9Z19DRAFT_1166361 [Tuber borchii]
MPTVKEHTPTIIGPQDQLIEGLNGSSSRDGPVLTEIGMTEDEGEGEASILPKPRFLIPSSQTVTTLIGQGKLVYMALPPDACRSMWRNAHIYATNGHDNLIGGLWVAEGITNANLYSMVGIICPFTDTFYLRYYTVGLLLVERNQNPLQRGNYLIVTNDRSLLYFSH